MRSEVLPRYAAVVCWVIVLGRQMVLQVQVLAEPPAVFCDSGGGGVGWVSTTGAEIKFYYWLLIEALSRKR